MGQINIITALLPGIELATSRIWSCNESFNDEQILQASVDDAKGKDTILILYKVN